MDVKTKPAKAHNGKNASGFVAIGVVKDSRLRHYISMRSGKRLPSTREIPDFVHEYYPPIPTRYSFNSHPVRANPEMLTAGGRFVKQIAGSKMHQIVSVAFYQDIFRFPYDSCHVTSQFTHQRDDVMSIHDFAR